MRGTLIVGFCVALAAPVACTVTTDFDGLAGEALAIADGGVDATVDVGAGPIPDASGFADGDAGRDDYRAAVLADKPSAYWTFDEATGSGFAADVVGGFDARVQNDVVFGVPGVRGTAIRFSRTGYLDVGDHFVFAGKAPYTVEAWVRFVPPTTNVTFYDVVTKRDSPTSGYVLYVRYDPPSLPAANWEHNLLGGGRGAYRQMTSNAWTHIAVTFDPALTLGVETYVDGIGSNGFDDAKDGPVTTSTLRLGAGMSGDLDEIAIYDHALSVERIGLHASLGKP